MSKLKEELIKRSFLSTVCYFKYTNINSKDGRQCLLRCNDDKAENGDQCDKRLTHNEHVFSRVTKTTFASDILLLNIFLSLNCATIKIVCTVNNRTHRTHKYFFSMPLFVCVCNVIKCYPV